MTSEELLAIAQAAADSYQPPATNTDDLLRIAQEAADAYATQAMAAPQQIPTGGDSWMDHLKAGLVQAGSNIRYAPLRGLVQHVASSYDPERDPEMFSGIASKAQEFADYLGQRQQQMTGVARSIASEPDTTLERAIEAAPDTVRRFAPWLVGGPLVGAPMSYVESYAQKMNEAKDRGADMNKAILTSAPAALVETAIEGGFGPEAAAAKVAAGGVLKNLGKTVLKSAAEEGIVEEPGQLAVDYGARALQGEFDGRTLGDVANQFIPEAYEQAKVGALLGGALGGGTFVAQSSINSALDTVEQNRRKEKPWAYGIIREDLPFDSTRFYGGVKSIVGDEKATATMEALTARARSAGENVDEYVAKRVAGLVLDGTPPAEALYQMAAEEAPGPVWYSRLSDIVEQKIPKSVSKEQLIATLRNNQVNEEELKYSGLLDLPDGALLTKDQVRQVLDDEAVRVEVKVLGGPGQGGRDFRVVDENGSVVASFPLFLEAAEYVDTHGGDGGGLTIDNGHWGGAKYISRDELWTPNGTNRREILITIPRRGTMANVPGVTSQHYGDVDPNTIAHSRVQDFTLEDGTKVLEVTEVQSDPHQKARDLREEEILRIATERGIKRTDKEGLSKIAEEVPKEFGYDTGASPFDSYKKALDDYVSSMVRWYRETDNSQPVSDEDLRLNYERSFEEGMDIGLSSKAERFDPSIKEKRRAALTALWRLQDNNYGSAIPDIPFKRNWEELVAKHILRYAAENGYDMVAWTTGEEQVKRNSDSFRQSVDELSWGQRPRTDGTVDVAVSGKTVKMIINHRDGLVEDVIMLGLGDKHKLVGKSLSEIFGKSVAEKIMSSPSGSLSGEGLTVGGEGFKAAYDVRLPSIFKKISKAAVEMVELPGELPLSEKEIFDWDGEFRVTRVPLEVARLGVKSHAIRISPDLRRQQLLKGNAKWQRGKAAVVFGDDGRAIIYAFAGADVSSVAHELAHIFERDLDPEQRSVIRAEYGDGVKASESFARGFERYLATGKAPTPRLRDVFSKYKIWMSEIYGKIEDSDIDVPISGRVRSVFDSLLIHRPDTKGRIIHSFEEASYVLQRLARLADTSDPDEADKVANERALLALGVNPLGAGDEFDVLDAKRLAYEDMNKAQPRSLADAISDFRNAVAAGAAKVESGLEAAYEKLRKYKKLPRDAKGQQISFEEYAELRKEKTRKEIENALVKATAEVGPDAPTSRRIEALDAATARVLKQRRLKPTQIGFRGELYPIDAKTHDKTLNWLKANGSDTADPKKMVELAGEAPEDIRMAVSLLLSGEARKRAAGEFRESPLLETPQRVIETELKEIDDDLNARLFGPSKRDYREPTLWDKVEGWVGNEFSTDKLGLKRHMAGLSRTKKRQLVRFGEAVNAAGERLKARLIYKANVYASEADTVVNNYLERQRLLGAPAVTKSEVFERMGRAYEANNYEQVGDEQLAQFLRDRTAPLMNEVSTIVANTITDNKLRMTIRQNFNAYLFRRYAFFDSKANYWAKLNRESAPYKALFDSIKEKKREAIVEQFQRLHGRDAEALMGSTTDANDFIEQFVDARVHGEVEKLIYKHARVPGATPKIESRIGRPGEEYLIERVLDDENVQKLLGKKEQLDFAVHNFITETAGDLHLGLVRAGMAKAFQKMGLLRTREQGPVSAPGEANALGNSRLVHATTMKEFDQNQDGTAEYYYVHPVVKAFFDGVDEKVGLHNKAVSAFIGMHKSLLVISPGNYESQVLSWPQGVMSAVGLTRAFSFFAPGNLRQMWRLSKELTKPGSVKDEHINEALRITGMTQESVRSAVDELISFGLDEAGEYAHDIKAATQALVEVTNELKAENRLRSALTAAGGVTAKAHEFFRRPDVMVKVFAYQSNIRELMDIEGLASPKDPTPQNVPDHIKREAAAMALMTTQTPATTPNIIRRIAGRDPKSVPGALFALANYGFQTFAWQSAKLNAMGYYYGFRHIKRALDPALADDPVKQSKYLQYGVSRVAGSAAASYFMWSIIREAFFDDDEEKTEAAKRSLFTDQRYGRVFGGIPAFLNFGKEVPLVTREDGRVQLNVTDFGQVDLSETFLKSVGLLIQAGVEGYKEIQGESQTPGRASQLLDVAIKESLGMLFNPSPGVQLGGKMLGVEFTRTGEAYYDKFIPRLRQNHPLSNYADPLNTETPFPLTAPLISLITNEGIKDAALDATGTMPKAAYLAVRDGLKAVGVVQPEESARPSRSINPGGRAFYRHTTGTAPVRYDAAGMYNGAMSAEWDRDWDKMKTFVARWKQAVASGNMLESSKVVAEGEPLWNRMVGRVADKLGEMQVNHDILEIDWMVNDKKIKTNTVPYKDVIVPILYQNYQPTFEDYLNSRKIE